MKESNHSIDTLEKVREQRGVEVRRYNALQKELKKYKELLEKQLKVTVDYAPIDLSYNGQHAWVMGVKSTALYALEMLPEIAHAT